MTSGQASSNHAGQGAFTPMRPLFTAADVEEARRLNAKLDRLPRLRMQTWFGRVMLNAALWLVELYPLLRSERTERWRELRTVSCLGRTVKLRIFHPPRTSRGVVLDIHGGGWTIGNARINDGENARLAARLDVTVISVDYGLAITGRVSDLVDDCEAAALWTVERAGREFGGGRTVIKGASAGAHLAALTLLRLRERDRTLAGVAGAVLLFGLYDFSGTDMVRQAGKENLILHGPTVRTTLCKLTPDMTDEQRRNPSISPLYADLAGLPAALFVVGEEDMLLEDSERMEAKWREANGNSTLLVAPASPHAFDRFTTEIARKVQAAIDEWSSKLFTSSAERIDTLRREGCCVRF